MFITVKSCWFHIELVEYVLGSFAVEFTVRPCGAIYSNHLLSGGFLRIVCPFASAHTFCACLDGPRYA